MQYLRPYRLPSPRLTWRDLQHIIARSARFPGRKPSDLVTNGAGLKGMTHPFCFSQSQMFLLYTENKRNLTQSNAWPSGEKNLSVYKIQSLSEMETAMIIFNRW